MEQERKLQFFNGLVSYLWGSLWWCREDFVMQQYSGWHENDRAAHPVVSLRRTPFKNPAEVVPMLVGTSGAAGPVIVKGLTLDLGEEHLTSFGTIIEPGWFTMADFTKYENCAKNVQHGPWTKVKMMWPNLHKPKLDKSEDIQARAFAIHYKNLIRYPNGEQL